LTRDRIRRYFAKEPLLNLGNNSKTIPIRGLEDRMSAKAQEVASTSCWWERFKGGDGSAFDEMVGRYWNRIYSMVNQLLRQSPGCGGSDPGRFHTRASRLGEFSGRVGLFDPGSTRSRQILPGTGTGIWWRRKRDKSVSIDAPLGTEGDATLADVIPAEVETPDDITSPRN